MFGDAYIYMLFADRTDPYWARSRALEYLSQTQATLPAEARAGLGLMPRASVGFMNTRWWTAAAGIIWQSCAHYRIG